jgi:hypothetical protein
MKNQLYRAPLAVAPAFLVAAIIPVTLAPSAVAQNPEIKQQIQQSVAANKQRLARYTWREQQTVSLKGEVKSQTVYQVGMGPDGKPQKTQVGAPPPPPSGGRLKKRVIEKKTEELKQYAQQIAGLVQSYVPPNPERMQQAFQQGSAAFSNTGPDAVRVAFTNYNMPGDSVTLVFNTAQKGIQSVEVSSFLNNDPKDAVTFSAQFAKLPDGTNHMANATVNGEKKDLTIQIQNTHYQML